MKEHDIHFRIGSRDLELLKQRAEYNRMTMSEYVRQLIYRDIDAHELPNVCVVPLAFKDTEYVSVDLSSNIENKSISAYCHDVVMRNIHLN